jgi:hypothetical protein
VEGGGKAGGILGAGVGEEDIHEGEVKVEVEAKVEVKVKEED